MDIAAQLSACSFLIAAFIANTFGGYLVANYLSFANLTEEGCALTINKYVLWALSLLYITLMLIYRDIVISMLIVPMISALIFFEVGRRHKLRGVSMLLVILLGTSFTYFAWKFGTSGQFGFNTASLILASFLTGYFVRYFNWRGICILFACLFVYDIYAVFFSNIMVELGDVLVAYNIPMLLYIPDIINGGYTAQIGTGDLMIPALLAVFAINKSYSVGKKYLAPLIGAVIGYAIGITVAFIVLMITDHPQPALLYIVPTTWVGYRLGVMSYREPIITKHFLS